MNDQMDRNSMADIELVTPAAIVRSSVDYVIDENHNNATILHDPVLMEAEQRKGLLDDSDSDEEQPDAPSNTVPQQTRPTSRCPSTPSACYHVISTSLPFRLLLIVAIIAVFTLQPGSTM